MGLAAAVASLSLLCPPAAAQDIPWGKSTKPTRAKKAQKKTQDKAQKKKPAAVANKIPAAAPKAAPVPHASSPVVVTPQQAVDSIVDEVARRTHANPFPGAAPPPATADPAASGQLADPLGSLHQALSRYGLWVDHAEHGTLWIPDPAQVGSDFAPYRSAGRWAVDQDANWSWVSAYPWGELPFHFGNWTWLDGEQGWAWVPGTEAAPAWVVWRLGDARHDFVGWAPMPPSHRWVDGKREALPGGDRRLAFWYLPGRDLFSPDAASHVVRDSGAAREIHGHSTTFAGNLSQCMSLDSEGQLQRRCASGVAASPWLAATPSFANARIPLDAIPLTRLAAPKRSFSRVVRRLINGTDIAGEPPVSHRSQQLETPVQPRQPRPPARRLMRRCVRTRSHGMKCWNYRWPPLWRGRR
jgi:hypothetical protein